MQIVDGERSAGSKRSLHTRLSLLAQHVEIQEEGEREWEWGQRRVS